MSRLVLIVDDDEDLRVSLSDVLALKCGAECVTAADVASMIQLGPRALASRVAILDVNLGAGQPSGLDAYRWLVDNGFTGRVVFLTGHARAHGMVQQAVQGGQATVVQKPASFAVLCQIIEEAAA